MKNISTAQRKTLREFLDERMARYSSVARALGISAPHLNALMNGTRPVTEDNAAKLADLFGVPASTFLPEALCHCGSTAQPNGNGLADTCDACLSQWLAAGEPEECPCDRLAGVL